MKKNLDNPVPSLDKIYKEYLEIIDAQNKGNKISYKHPLGSYDSGEAVELFFGFLKDRLQNGVETEKN